MRQQLAMAALALVLAGPALAGPALAGPALADEAPPADAMALSEILQGIEQEADFRHFEEIEWDDDGYWEVEYRNDEGREVKVRIDPVTGQAR